GLGDDLPVGGDEDGVADAGGSLGLAGLGGTAGAGGVGGGDGAGGVHCAGGGQRGPLGDLVGAVVPAGGQRDHFGAGHGQVGEVLGEADVEAGGQAEADGAPHLAAADGDVDDDGFRAGGDGVGFAEPVGVEKLDFVVVGVDAGAGDQQRVVHAVEFLAVALNVVGGAEHAEHDGEAGGFRGVADAGGEGPVEWFGGGVEAPGAEGLHRRLGEHDEVRVLVRGALDGVLDGLQVLLRLGGQFKLGECDAHAPRLPAFIHRLGRVADLSTIS